MQIADISRHADTRRAQRGFRGDVLEALYAYGASKRRNGAEVFFMDRAARRRVIDAVGAKGFARMEKQLNSYIVVGDDGTLVTCAKRLKRLR